VPLPHYLSFLAVAVHRINQPQTNAPGLANLIATGYQPLPARRTTQNSSLQRFWGLTVSSYTLSCSLQDPAFGGSLNPIFPTLRVPTK
jgi:hypothetical protein